MYSVGRTTPVKYIVPDMAEDHPALQMNGCSQQTLYEVTGESDQVVHCPWQGFASLQHYLDETP